jgi:hypothetical protein
MPPILIGLIYLTALALVLAIAVSGSWLTAIVFAALVYLLLRELPWSHLFDKDSDTHEKPPVKP